MTTQITLKEIQNACGGKEERGEIKTLCPHCQHHALGIKPGDTAPVVAYCSRPRLRRFLMSASMRA